ncbi:MAG: hypothetical protein IJ184_07230 [Alphaproteobacteria bacterium]|nr:hypothetical protein [Alphaproteobacteria bacterium]
MTDIQVYGEDLDVGAVLTGGTMSALELKVYAEADEVSIDSSAKVTVTHSDTEDGTFATVLEAALTAGDYKSGDVIATISLPSDIKMWAKASVTGNTGAVKVKQAYLPR